MKRHVPRSNDAQSAARIPIRRSPTLKALAAKTWNIKFWVECVCFFLIATPFELEMGSGYAYAIKAFACILLLAPRLVLTRASIDARMAWIVVLAVLFLAVNIQSPSDRLISAFFLIPLGASLGLLKNTEWNQRLLDIVTVYLLVHLGGFMFSFVEFVLRGSVLDLHGMLFPAQSRAHVLGSAARLSGFHNEPGTYAQWMLMVTFLRCLLTQRIASPLTLIVGITALATLSLWAVAGGALLLIAVLLDALSRGRMERRVRAVLSTLLICAAAAMAITVLPGSFLQDALTYLGVKAEMSTVSGLSKLWALRELQSQFSEVLVLGGSMDPGFCPYCPSPQDLGTWASSAYYFGILPYALFIALLTTNLLRVHGLPYMPFLAIMLIWKAAFYDPLLWMIIGYALATPVIQGGGLRRLIDEPGKGAQKYA